jgi:hypothetical protein
VGVETPSEAVAEALRSGILKVLIQAGKMDTRVSLCVSLDRSIKTNWKAM